MVGVEIRRFRLYESIHVGLKLMQPQHILPRKLFLSAL